MKTMTHTLEERHAWRQLRSTGRTRRFAAQAEAVVLPDPVTDEKKLAELKLQRARNLERKEAKTKALDFSRFKIRDIIATAAGTPDVLVLEHPTKGRRIGRLASQKLLRAVAPRMSVSMVKAILAGGRAA